MAISLGNLALLLDLASPRGAILERKARPVGSDVVLSSVPSKRDSPSACCYAPEGDGRSRLVLARGKSNSEKNGVEFDSDEEEEEEEEEEEGGMEDWETEMRRRVREFEARRELEKKAEELQNRVDEGKEETEEEKRMRVRKELEKVLLLF